MSADSSSSSSKIYEQKTKTTSGPVQKLRRIPPWVFGLAGFILVALVTLGIFYFKNNLSPIDKAKLQGGVVWSQHLPGVRTLPTTPVIADINGDSMLDVIVGDASGFLLALDGEKGLKIFDAQVADRILAPLIAIDLTGNHIADIITSSTSGEVLAFNGKGQKLWESDPNLKLGEIVNRPVVADLNNDHIPDIVVPTANKGLIALDGNRGWLIWETGAIFKDKIICAPVKADVNHDGLMDFVAVTQNGHVVAITSKNSKVWKLWEANVPEVFYASPLYLKAGDKELIVIPTNKQGIIALNANDGRLAWTSPVAEQFFASPVAVDANSDHVPDIALVAVNGDIHVLDGATGDEIWSLAIGTKVQATPALFDFNRDGLKDLLILDTAARLLCIDMARGRISLVIKVDGADSFIASPVLGDVNGDGLLNIIAASKNGNISALFLNRSISKGSIVWPVFQGVM